MRKLSQKVLSCLLVLGMLITNQSVFLSVLADDVTTGRDVTNEGEDVFTRSLALSYTDQNDLSHEIQDHDTLQFEDVKTIEAQYQFQVTDHESDVTHKLYKNDYYIMNLPKGIVFEDIPESKINHGENTIAHYQITKIDDYMQIKVTFTEYVERNDIFDIAGSFHFSFDLRNFELGAGESKDLVIPVSPSISSTITIQKAEEQPAPKPVLIQKRVKAYDEQLHTITWELEITGERNEPASLAGCILSDTLNESLTFTSLTKNNEEVNVCQIGSETGDASDTACYQYDQASKTIQYVFGEDEQTNPMVVTITTEIDEQLFATKDKTTIENKATLTGGSLHDGTLNSNIAQQIIDPKWISKDGSVIEGNRIQWNIKVNQAHQYMHNAIITDTMSKDLIMPETIKLKEITSDGSTSEPIELKILNDMIDIPSDDSKSYAIKQNDHSFQLYFPRTSSYATNASYEITYITDLTPYDDTQENNDQPSYQNDVRIEVSYGPGDKPFQPIVIDIQKDGISVPKVVITDHTITSSAEKIAGHDYTIAQEFKKYGIITWEMHTSSNLDNYQGAIIENLIADNQKIYLNEQGKPELFWWNPDTKQWMDIFLEETQVQLFDATIVPTATYSGNTITIQYPKENCLKKQQKFRVRTQVNDYEQNILDQQIFTNEANVAIYRTEGDGTKKVVSESNHAANQPINNVVLKKQAELLATKTPTVRYTITCNENNMPLTAAKVIDDLNQIETTFSITDGETKSIALPWVYVPGSIEIKRTTNGEAEDHISLDAIIQQAEAAYDQTDNKLTFDFGSNTIHNKYTISFEVALQNYQNEPLFSLNGSLQCKGNQAKLEAGNIVNNTISSAPTQNLNQPLQNEMLSKSGNYQTTNGRQGHWIIHINQREAMLHSTTLEDYMDEAMVLDPTSVALYKDVLNDQGEFLSESEIRTKATKVNVQMQSEFIDEGIYAGTYKVTFELPEDQTAYVLIYDTDIEDSVSINTSLSNQIQLAGREAEKGTSSSIAINVTTAAGGNATTRSSVQVLKLDNETSLPLPNTQIGLYQKIGEDYILWKSQWTNVNGEVNFYGLKANTSYYLQEITPVDGYANDHEEFLEIQTETDAKTYTYTWEDAKIKHGSFQFQAIKELTGAQLKNQQFTFGIFDKDDVCLATGTNDETGLITFAEFDDFTKENLFTSSHLFSASEQAYEEVTSLWIKEIIPTNIPEGYTYDQTIYEVTLHTINIRNNDALEIQLKDTNGNLLSDNNRMNEDAITFKNTYQEVIIPPVPNPSPEPTPNPDPSPNPNPNPPTPPTPDPSPITPPNPTPTPDPSPITPPSPTPTPDFNPITPPNSNPNPIISTPIENTNNDHMSTSIDQDQGVIVHTGDSTSILLYVSLILLSLSSMLYYHRKWKKQ